MEEEESERRRIPFSRASNKVCRTISQEETSRWLITFGMAKNAPRLSEPFYRRRGGGRGGGRRRGRERGRGGRTEGGGEEEEEEGRREKYLLEFVAVEGELLESGTSSGSSLEGIEVLCNA